MDMLPATKLVVSSVKHIMRWGGSVELDMEPILLYSGFSAVEV